MTATSQQAHGSQAAVAEVDCECCDGKAHAPPPVAPVAADPALSLDAILAQIEAETLSGPDMEETRVATFGRLRKEWANPPVKLMDAALPAGWAGADATADQKAAAARVLLFDPTPAMMAHYPPMVADAATLSLQVPSLTLFYLKHVKRWPILRAFIEEGGMATIARLIGTDNVYLRSQAIDIFQQASGGTEGFDWFHEPTEADYRLFEGLRSLMDGDLFVTHAALSVPEDDFPGGSMYRLQMLAFWLSWLRLHYTEDNVLKLGPSLLAVLRDWKPQSDGPEEAALAKQLLDDFSRVEAAAIEGPGPVITRTTPAVGKISRLEAQAAEAEARLVAEAETKLRAERVDPDVEILKQAGNAALKAGQPEEAIFNYTKALTLLGDVDGSIAAVLLTNRAIAKLGDGFDKQQAELASVDCKAAIQACPSYTKGHYRLGQSLLAAGHPAHAERAAANGLKTTGLASPAAKPLKELEKKARAARMAAAGDEGDGWRRERQEAGDSLTYPRVGERVTVHYTGWLASGTKDTARFDSSVEKGKPFRFKVGVGEVIQGWDDGVGRMCLGERALLHVGAKAGYGSMGAGAKIPPDSDLVFEVELLAVGSAEAPALAAAMAKGSRPDMARVMEQVDTQMSRRQQPEPEPEVEESGAVEEEDDIEEFSTDGAAKLAEVEKPKSAPKPNAASKRDVKKKAAAGLAVKKVAKEKKEKAKGFFDKPGATLYPKGSEEGTPAVDPFWGPGGAGAFAADSPLGKMSAAESAGQGETLDEAAAARALAAAARMDMAKGGDGTGGAGGSGGSGAKEKCPASLDSPCSPSCGLCGGSGEVDAQDMSHMLAPKAAAAVAAMMGKKTEAAPPAKAGKPPVKKDAEVGMVEPRYTILHVEDAKQRYTLGGKMERLKAASIRPKAITVSIELPRLSSAAGLDLDVNDETLKLGKPGMYSLELKLPFPVDSDNGSAKFDKSTSKMVVTLPVRPAAET